MDSRQASRKAGEGPAATLKQSLLPVRYRVLEQVAVGGMGSVWVADDQLLGRQVAVKVLAEQLASQPLFVKRFEREARTAAALSGHPNVVTIYDVGEHDGRPFIVMAYLPGGTVRDRIKAGNVRLARRDRVDTGRRRRPRLRPLARRRPPRREAPEPALRRPGACSRRRSWNRSRGLRGQPDRER